MEPESAATEGTERKTDRRKRLLNVTVLMGGPSAEREVSFQSGSAIAEALERVGHRVTRADITPESVSSLDAEGIDVVFIALHGQFGESGEVQQLCEERGLPYTGSDPVASQLGLDKAASKQIFRRAGLTTPEWMIIEEHHAPAKRAKWLLELSPPVVLKPVNGGSSVDITIARDAAQRDEALEELLDKYGRGMLEEYVEGRELTVGILGDEALPVLEIVPAGEFYDYHAKYADDSGTRYVFDHGLPPDVVDSVAQAAMKAHQAIGARDMSRVDFILDSAGAVNVIEINTIPGFTSHSLLPMAAAKVGIRFDELVDRLVAMAAGR